MKRKLTAAERKILYEIFADYRAYKVAISSHTFPVKRGFTSAQHPDQIRAPRVHAPEPRGLSGCAVTPGFNASSLQRFVWRVDYHVKQLQPYRRSIIRLRFLGREPLPSDDEVHLSLRSQGWYVSKSYYKAEKLEGLAQLLDGMRDKEFLERTN